MRTKVWKTLPRWTTDIKTLAAATRAEEQKAHKAKLTALALAKAKRPPSPPLSPSEGLRRFEYASALYQTSGIDLGIRWNPKWAKAPIPKRKRVPAVPPPPAPAPAPALKTPTYTTLDTLVHDDEVALPPFPSPQHNSVAITFTWGAEGTLVGKGNVVFLPPPSYIEETPPSVCADGCWGLWDWWRMPQPYDDSSPHLAFMPIGNSPDDERIEFRPSRTSDWQADPFNRGFRRTTDEVHETLVQKIHGALMAFNLGVDLKRRAFDQGTEDWKTTPANAQGVANAMRSMRIPDLAMSRLHISAAAMRWGSVNTRAEAVALWRSFQRSLAEIEAFVFFVASAIQKKKGSHDIKWLFSFAQQDRVRRGVILYEGNSELFDDFAAFGAPVYKWDFKPDSAEPKKYTEPWFSTEAELALRE
jgi:hypothetical protein